MSRKMVQFDIEEVSVPRSKKYQVLAAVVANIGTISLGSAIGFTAFFLPALEESIEFREISPSEKSWIASIVAIGAILASPITEICLENFGRRHTILIMAVSLILAYILISCAQNVYLLCLGRFFTGLSAASYFISVPLYVREIAEDDFLKYLEAVHHWMIPLGILISYVAGSQLSWLWFAIVSTLIPMLLLCWMIYMPETPYYFLLNNKSVKAGRSIKWLGMATSDSEIKLKINQMQDTIQHFREQRENSRFSDLFSFPLIKSTIICVALQVFQQCSLITFFLFNSVDILTKVGISVNVSHVVSIIFSAVLLVTVILSTSICINTNRKLLLCISSAGSSICLCLFGIFWFFLPYIAEPVSQYIFMTILVMYTILYGIGLSYLPQEFTTRLLSAKPGRKFHLGLALLCGWLAMFAITKTFNDLNDIVGISVSYWIFMAISVVSLPFAYCVVEEGVEDKTEENSTPAPTEDNVEDSVSTT